MVKGDRRIGRAGEAADRRDPWNRWDSQRRDRDQRGVVRVRVDVVGLGRDLQGVLLGDAVAERVADHCSVREAERDDDAGHLFWWWPARGIELCRGARGCARVPAETGLAE